jgi:hypothetical protein
MVNLLGCDEVIWATEQISWRSTWFTPFVATPDFIIRARWGSEIKTVLMEVKSTSNKSELSKHRNKYGAYYQV